MNMKDHKGERSLGANRMDDLSLKEIRSCYLFAHLSDKQISEILDTLKQFTIVVFDYYERKESF